MAATPLRCLFVTDHPFPTSPDGAVWSPGKMPYAVWARYLKHFGSMTIVGRQGPTVVPSGNLSRSDGPHVTFQFAPSLASPTGLLFRRAEVAHMIEMLLGEHDVMVARVPSFIGLTAAGVARKMSKPYVLEVAGCPRDGFSNHGSPKAKAMAPIMARWLRFETMRAPALAYVTENFLQSRYPPALHASVLIASNVELASVEEAVLERRLAHIAAMDGKSATLGLVGGVGNELKGHTVVLEALRRLKDRLPGLRFKMLGDGDPARLLTRAAQLGVADQIDFCGTLPGGKAVLEWLDEVDIYLQPSFREGLPRALIEAMSRGCPSLGSTAGGIGELLPADALHRPGDAATLAAQIERCMGDKDWLAEQARRNHTAAKRYVKAELDARRAAFWEQTLSTPKAAA